ncbi:MAG: glycine oxidase ThiO [Acidimicrobiales bacterium]
MNDDAIVVGGGVIGLSSAWRASQEGLRVTVVDPSPARGASWVAAGMLAPVTEATFGEEGLTRLLVAAAERWPEFAAELGDDIGYHRSGTVVVAADTSDRAVVDELLDFQHSLGLCAERLTASGCRELVPALAPGVRGGAHVPGDHQVDNRRLLDALLEACRDAGVGMVEEAVGSLELGGDGAVSGVTLDDGSRLRAGSVVVAAGAHSGCLGGVPVGALPAVRPVKGHIVRLRGPEPLIDRTVRGLVHGRPCYLVPRQDGSLVVGATAEERGFDRTVQAGAVHDLLDDARTLVPGIDELELVECRAGLRPGSADNGPFVGWTAVPGLAVATGHYRNGVLLAPLTALAVAALLAGGDVPSALSGFGPQR